MGQYHYVYNIDKREFIDGDKINNGLKLLEQCGNSDLPTTSDAVWLLLSNSNGRGGGDAPDHKLIGRWAGDRLVVQGDYARDGDTEYMTKDFISMCADISAEVKDMLHVVFGGD